MKKISVPIVRTKLVKQYDIDLYKEKVFGIEGAQQIFYELIGESAIEMFAVVCLESNNKIINACIINIGNNKKVDVSTSELFRVALLSNAASIIICHNHPTGDLRPSLYDIEITKKIGYVGSMLGINLIDSLIIGENGQCFSIRSEVKRMEKSNE